MQHTGPMGLLDRFRRSGRGGTSVGGGGTTRASDEADQRHLLEFVVTRRGVEGLVEPRTTVTDVTLLLVAHDGEWTRRRVPSVQWAHEFCNRNGVPSYDAALVGIPTRMREYNRREKERQRRQLRRDLEGPADQVLD
ncbi:MAG: hypothetical protein JWQ67_80 [Marmoricola sp.]|jgi:hypothetical protein|nr:hypothetical protein [Marmoricola sp.]MCW2808817.1 hypothetical protein [Marmoricola sp.]MCW2820712.1 hypothetical protein [Marmoricola sp.]MCW2826464.1 hypothetical protein [Marmoricola sp.]